MKVIMMEPGKIAKVKDIDPSLESMQAIVGGPIELFYCFKDEVAIVCNENGKIDGLPANRFVIDPKTDEICEILCGTVFLCGLGEEDIRSLTNEEIEKYMKLFTALNRVFPMDVQEDEDAN